MDGKKIFFIFIISTLLIGSAFAAKSVNDFKVNDTYKHVFGDDYYSINIDDKQDSGITIYKNVDDDNHKDNDRYDKLIKDEGKDYLKADKDMKINKNPDNTANFTDMDHATHGISELVEVDGQQFVVVVWAKDSSNIQNSDLALKLAEFNQNNQVKALAF